MGWRRCSFRAQVLQARLVAALISDVWVLCVPRESHIPQSPTACLCAQLCRSRSAPATRQAEHKQFSTNRLPSRAGGYSLHGALAEPLRISRAESDPLQESLPFPAASTALPASQGGPRASGNVRPTFLQRKGLITEKGNAACTPVAFRHGRQSSAGVMFCRLIVRCGAGSRCAAATACGAEGQRRAGAASERRRRHSGCGTARQRRPHTTFERRQSRPGGGAAQQRRHRPASGRSAARQRWPGTASCRGQEC